MDNRLVKTPIRQGLIAPILVMGTEVNLIILNAIFCIVYALSTRFHWPVLFIIIIAPVLHTACVLISRADPMMIGTFRRSHRYRGYFPPISGINSVYDRPFSAFPEKWWQS